MIDGGWSMAWTAWLDQHTALLVWLAVVSVATLVASAIALPWLIMRIPVDYFANGKHHATPWADRHPMVRALLLAGKNLLGLALILAGIAMLVLPGQGILTIVAGLALVDFPGRHRLVLWFVCQSVVLRSINWIRTRAWRPHLVVGCPPAAAAGETPPADRSPPLDGPSDHRTLDTPAP